MNENRFGRFERMADQIETAAHLPEELDAEQWQALREAIVRDPAARAAYLRYLADAVVLREWASGRELPAAEACHAATEHRPDDAMVSRPPLWSRAARAISPRRHPGRFVAASAAGTAACWLLLMAWLVPHWRSARPPAAPPNFVAQLVEIDDARWAAGQEVPEHESFLRAGRRLALERGRIEVEFLSGARVLLEGPAAIRLEGENACQLQSGKLLAQVPRPAVGFSVDTETLLLTDLGTEFGLQVEEETQEVDLEVFSGSVRIDLKQSPAGSPPEQSAMTVHRETGPLRVMPGAGPAVRETEEEIPSFAAMRQQIRPSANRLWLHESFRVGDDPRQGHYRAGSLEDQDPDQPGAYDPWQVNGTVRVSPEPLEYEAAGYRRAEQAGSVVLPREASHAYRRLQFPVSDRSSGVRYISFLMQLHSADDRYRGFELWQQDRRVLSLGTSAQAVDWRGNVGMFVNDDPALFATLGPIDTEVNLYVLRFELNERAGGDALTVWRNPPLERGPDPPGGATIRGLDIEFNRFGFRRAIHAEGGAEHGAAFGEVRLGSTWQSVLEGRGAD